MCLSCLFSLITLRHILNQSLRERTFPLNASLSFSALLSLFLRTDWANSSLEEVLDICRIDTSPHTFVSSYSC